MKKVLAILATVILSACAGDPTIQQGPNAETSFDGLVQIDNSRFLHAWIDPDVDLQSYSKVVAGNAEFEFRAVKRRPGSLASSRNSQTEFWISDENRARLIDEVTAVFREELANSRHFEIADSAGPDTLVLIGALLDIVSNVPPDRVGRSEVFLSQIGEATLVLELRDSQSGETIYRAVDRRRIDPRTGAPGMTRSNEATTWAEVRRWARRWAVSLREGLDSIHE